MRVIITGLPYFSGIIQQKLNAYSKDDHFIKLDTYYRFLDRIFFLILLPFADVIYSINGSLHGSRVINLALFFKKRIVFHWVGSDVLTARKHVESNNFNRNYVSGAIHIADAPWLVEELSSMGIESVFVPLHTFNVNEEPIPEMPERFSILCYIPEGREKFYGFDYIIRLAEKIPDVEIKIAGMRNYPDPLPMNIKLLGWVGNMKEEICNCSVSIRMPEHDGLSFFVLESLTNQRYVIYNQKFDPSIFADDDQSLMKRVNELRNKHENNELSLNREGGNYLHHHFNEAMVIRKILQILTGNT